MDLRKCFIGCVVLGASFFIQASTLVPLSSDWQYLRGLGEASSPDATDWRQISFSDASWDSAPAPFWYGDYQPAPSTELSDMRHSYTCVFLRQTFDVSNPNAFSDLELGAQSDDGFIAWINGAEVARFNMPLGDLDYDDASLPALFEPIPFQQFTIPNPGAFLVAGQNVLAVQAFNSSISGSSDFVIDVSLEATEDLSAPFITDRFPSASAIVPRLSQIEIIFSEGVSGVDAADLLINGTPATDRTAYSAAQYVFTFPQVGVGTVNVGWASDHGITDLAISPNAFVADSWSYLVDPDFRPPSVLINEFMADNQTTLNDRFGDDSDWIELYNPGDQSVAMNGWFLTDTTNNPAKWRIPNVVLAPNEYLVVFASGRDLTDPGQQLHTNFRLSNDGGYLGLLDSETNVVSAFFPAYPPQEEDVSYGRAQSNPTLLGYFVTATPWGPNSSSGPGFAPEVVFSQESGTFRSSFDLTLSLDRVEPGSAIRYTLDSGTVTESSPLYQGPIRITTTTQVRARSFTSGLLPGPAVTEIFMALDAGAQGFTTDLPIIILHNLGGGSVPAGSDQPVMLQAFESRNGSASMNNPPDVSSRGIFHLRGSSTLWYPKGSFFLETQDEVGDGRNVSLLGLPKESDWVLYAPNNFDPALINNAVAHELSRQMGQYSPRTRFAVVFLNTAGGAITEANYNGIYILEEKIKVDENRVDIDRLEPEHTALPEVSGGYLLSVDRSDEGTSPFYAGGQSLNYLSPKYVEMITPQREAQRQYIQTYLNQFYNALIGPSWRDPVSGYAAYLDVPAALDHHIQGIVTFNVDALRLSGYLRKPREGKIVMGPVWDFDRTQGSTDGRDFNPLLWRSPVPDYGTDMFNPASIYPNPWYSRLFQDIDFWQGWVDRYQELRASAFSDTNVAAVIDRLGGEVRQEQPREVNRWGIRPRSGTVSRGGYSYTFNGTYTGELTWMKHWYSQRLGFIDSEFLNRPALSHPGGDISPNTILVLSGPPGATLYYTLDGTDPRLPGGGIASGAKTYSSPIVLRENARVVARSRDLSHSNQTGTDRPPLSTPWSGKAAATYVVTTPPVVITELMYHPTSAPVGSTNSAGDFEYLELKNRGATTLDLTGARFTDGIDFTFASTNAITQLAPGERLVLVKNQAAFLSRYPGNDRIAGEFLGSLNNAGERIALIGPLQEPIHDFRFNDAWYPITDGFGFSLVIRDETAPLDTWTNALGWYPSSQLQGSPGVAEPPAPNLPRVVVSEALTHTDLPQVDTIELQNLSSEAVDLGGWLLTDDYDTPAKFRIPSPTLVGPGDFVLFTEFEFANALAGSFRLSSLGDEVYLFSADAATNLTGHLHGFEYGAAQNGVSFGRVVNSLGEEYFVSQLANSLNTTNRGPSVGPVIISEIMFHPPSVVGTNNNVIHEFVELQNTSGQPMNLFDSAHPTNRWRLRGGVDFDFPDGLTLPANGFAVVVGFDPATEPGLLADFRATYSLDAGATVLGPYSGKLENAGEKVRLLRPDTPQTAASPTPGFVPYILVESVDYLPVSPWPTNASGSGKSLQRHATGSFSQDPVHWVVEDPSPMAAAPGSASPDRDNDGLPNTWEVAYDLDPDDGTGPNGAAGDPDGDGLTNTEEFTRGTHPNVADTDEDLLPDGWEVAQGLDPLIGSGVNGADGDLDGDGMTNHQEFISGTRADDPESYLRIERVVREENTITLYVIVVSEVTYEMEYRDAAGSGDWQLLQSIVGQSGETPVIDTDLAPEATRFYRVAVSPPAG